MMELKQLAESITMLKYKKRLGEGALHFKNRPALWEERISADSVKTKRNRKLDSLDPKWTVQTNQLYMVSFDSSISLPNTWVDGHVMNLFNG